MEAVPLFLLIKCSMKEYANKFLVISLALLLSSAIPSADHIQILQIETIALIITLIILFYYTDEVRKSRVINAKILSRVEEKEVRDRTVEMFMYWESPQLQIAKRTLLNAKDETHIDSLLNSDTAFQGHVDTVLGYFETLGLMYKNNHVDRKMVNDHMYLAIDQFIWLLRYVINRAQKKHPESWTNAIYLLMRINESKGTVKDSTLFKLSDTYKKI